MTVPSIETTMTPNGSSVAPNTRTLDVHADIEYYTEPLIFQVGNTIFRVPREYLVQESPLFLEMLQLPQSSENMVDGSSDMTPLVLPEPVTAPSFRVLLRLLYSSDSPTNMTFTKDEWLAVLELSRMWDMARIRNIIISRLLPLLADDPAHQWNLAKKYEIYHWVRPAVEKLIRQNKPLGEREFEMLDQETLLKVANVRECCYPIFRDSDAQYGGVYGEDTTINRWEIRQERGEVIIDLSTFDFSCPIPTPPPHAQNEPVSLTTDGPWKSGEFYFEKVVFKVEDRLYRVPNQPFAQNSPVFRHQFENRGFLAYDRDDPFVIEEGVTKTDFEHLLRLFFPPQILGQWEPTPEEWASILRLSARWEMAQVKQAAVNKLQTLNFGNIATKIQMAQELGVQEWFSSGMATLIVRKEPLAASEYKVLTPRHVLQVLNLRERVHVRTQIYYGTAVTYMRSERGDLPVDVDLSARLTDLTTGETSMFANNIFSW